ncbi:MAG TPA: FKBP-type peptidyl-prolyl cis-trans isomerase [Bacteroidales bacterium]|nr:FKBP-type peptidyl-prolyl cis-trans isomerase [Bacteroidales bacterium]
MRNAILTFSFLLLLAISCGNEPRETENNKSKTDPKAERLVNINRQLVANDIEKIKGYIKRRNWNMQVTPTGLWYDISEKSTGPKATTGKKATIKYTVELLEDGTTCYSSEKTGPKTFTIGKGGIEAGLEEGILLLNEGGKAIFILPPHLAYGLLGDEKCIPARSIIIYHVELIKLTD